MVRRQDSNLRPSAVKTMFIYMLTFGSCRRTDEIVQVDLRPADEAVVNLDHLHGASIFVNAPLVDKDLLDQPVQDSGIQLLEVGVLLHDVDVILDVLHGGSVGFQQFFICADGFLQAGLLRFVVLQHCRKPLIGDDTHRILFQQFSDDGIDLSEPFLACSAFSFCCAISSSSRSCCSSIRSCIYPVRQFLQTGLPADILQHDLGDLR